MSTYYMRADGTAADKETATGPTTDATKCMNVTVHNAESFDPGDVIVLSHRGGDYDTSGIFFGLTIPSSGDASDDIVYRGEDRDNRPVLNHSVERTGWTYENPLWYVTVGAEPSCVIFDGARLVEELVKGNTGTGEYYWDSGNSRVYVADDPSSATVETTSGGNGVRIASKSYITFRDIIVEKAGAGINLVGNSSNITIRRVLAQLNDGVGIFSWDAALDRTDIIVDDCEAYRNWESGILLTGKSTDSQIINCHSHENCQNHPTTQFAAGIKVISDSGDPVTGVIFEDNVAHDNGTGSSHFGTGQGIWMDTVGSDCIMRRNLSYDNKEVGIYMEWAGNNSGVIVAYNISHDNEDGVRLGRRSQNVLVANNAAYNNTTYGLVVAGESPGDPLGMDNNIIRNNIASGNGTEFGAIYGGENDGTFGTGNVYDHNCFGAEAASFIEWGLSTYHSTYDAWEAVYGEWAECVEADPLWTDPGNGDFTLQDTSPCVKSGIDVGLTEDFIGNSISHPPDLGAYTLELETTGMRRISAAHFEGMMAMLNLAGLRILVEDSVSINTASANSYTVANQATRRLVCIHERTTFGDIRVSVLGTAGATDFPVLGERYFTLDVEKGDDISFYNANASTTVVYVLETD